jgi:hypothetical protein
MKNRYKYCLLMFSALFLFASCEKETEDISRITYFCELELIGNSTMMVPVGSTYTEPGYIATENEEDVSSSIVVSGTVNTNTPGKYVLNYSITNKDGFPKTAQRTVFVYDATSSILESGEYVVAAGSNRNGTAYAGYEIVVYQVLPGTFYITDFLGGWYEQRAGYGSTYAMTGRFALSGTAINLVSSYISGWKDGLDELENGVYDATTKTITYDVTYAGTLVFHVILTKK